MAIETAEEPNEKSTVRPFPWEHPLKNCVVSLTAREPGSDFPMGEEHFSSAFPFSVGKRDFLVTAGHSVRSKMKTLRCVAGESFPIEIKGAIVASNDPDIAIIELGPEACSELKKFVYFFDADGILFNYKFLKGCCYRFIGYSYGKRKGVRSFVSEGVDPLTVGLDPSKKLIAGHFDPKRLFDGDGKRRPPFPKLSGMSGGPIIFCGRRKKGDRFVDTVKLAEVITEQKRGIANVVIGVSIDVVLVCLREAYPDLASELRSLRLRSGITINDGEVWNSDWIFCHGGLAVELFFLRRGHWL